MLSAGLRLKAPTGATSMSGPTVELSGVGAREPFAGAWQRNITAEGPGSLLAFSPIYACATRIAADIAKLGLVLLTEADDGIPSPAPRASPYWTVLRRPNAFQNRIQFVVYWLVCKLIWGNAYALKLRDGRGMVSALYLADPRRVTPIVTEDGGVYYSIGADRLARTPHGLAAAPASEVIHDRGPTLWHPLIGVPPIFAAALSGTLGLQIQRNSAQFFANMSRPSGMLTAPKKIDEATAARLKREWNENYSAGNLGKLAVLGDGLEYEAMTIAAEQSQLAEQLGISAIDCATAFHMPAYKINQGPMPTNNNVQALKLEYYETCLQQHIEAMELLLDEGLELPDRYTVEFDMEGLLRMDSLTQMDVLTKGTKGGLIKPNEGRRRLRLPPVEGGDAVYMQQQDTSLAALAKRDARDDPFGAAPLPAVPGLPADDEDDEEAAAAAAAASEQRMLVAFETLAARASQRAAGPADGLTEQDAAAAFAAALADG